MSYLRPALSSFTNLSLSIFFSVLTGFLLLLQSLLLSCFLSRLSRLSFSTFSTFPSILRTCIPSIKPGGREAFSYPFVLSTSKAFLEHKMRHKKKIHTSSAGHQSCSLFCIVVVLGGGVFCWVMFCLPPWRFLLNYSEVSTVISVFFIILKQSETYGRVASTV